MGSVVTMRSRVLADLVVLDHFSKSYETDITSALKEKGLDAVKAFREIYQNKKGQSSIYEHRLDSIVGQVK